MKVVCVSDTHGLHEDALAVPPGDVFIHAGDFTDTGERSEVVAFNEFLGRLPHRYKLVIAGNHESSFDRQFYPEYWHQYGHRQQYDPEEVRALLTNALYLEDQAVLIEGYLFYGTPWQPEFCNWAFNLPRGDALLRQWRLIPTDTDVLITHTPPMGHGDLVGYQRVGCADLLREVETRIRPKLHVFGHVHEGYGRSTSPDGKITYLNASTCTHQYEPVNPPFVFELIGPPKRGWPKHTLPLTSPMADTSLGICRSFSSDDVSSLSTTNDASGTIEKLPKDYTLVLHEWLRLCSHKPPFLEKQHVATCELNGKRELREFRVDGTTAGLLFESTLKLRPVTNVHRRVLRYLFSQGFRSNSDNYKGEEGENEVAGVQSEKNEHEDVEEKIEATRESGEVTKERRKYGISRRVTVAVLDDIDEGKEGMDDRERQHVQQARLAAAAISKADGGDKDAQPRRPRRTKALQRRSAIPKLASLTEESSEDERSCTAEKSLHGKTMSEDAVVSKAVVVTSCVTECVLCKFKVPGHVHPAEKTSEDAVVSETIVVTSRVVECTLCKYKVSGHVHPDVQAPPPPVSVEMPGDIEEEEEEEKPSKSRSKTDNPPHKRLSSWF